MNEKSAAAVRARSAYARLGTALFIMAGVLFGIGYLEGLFVQALAEKGSALLENELFSWALDFVPMYFIVLPLGLLLMRGAPAYRVEGSKLGAGELALFALMCFPLIYGGSIIGNALSAALSRGQAVNRVAELAMEESPLKVLIFVFAAPLFEEYVFRKQLIDRSAQYGESTAVLFSALAFGLFHRNFFQFFYAFALGLLFAYIYVRTRRVRYSAGLHMMVNFLGSVAAPWVLSRGDSELLEQIAQGNAGDAEILSAFGSLAPLILYALAMMGLTAAGIVVLIRQVPKMKFLPAADEVEKGEAAWAAASFPVIIFVLYCIAMCVYSLGL